MTRKTVDVKSFHGGDHAWVNVSVFDKRGNVAFRRYNRPSSASLLRLARVAYFYAHVTPILSEECLGWTACFNGPVGRSA